MSDDKKYLVGLIIGIPLIFGAACFLIYQDSRKNRVPIDYAGWENAVKLQKQEFDKIKLPPETEMLEIEDTSKRGQSVFLTARYRTQLSNKDFVSYMKDELKKNDWVFYGKKEKEYSFCRVKTEAIIFIEGNGGMFSDKGNYVKLIFLSSFDGMNGGSDYCD